MLSRSSRIIRWLPSVLLGCFVMLLPGVARSEEVYELLARTKDADSLASTFKYLLVTEGRRYHYRAPRNQRPSTDGFMTVVPPHVSSFMGYSVRSITGPQLLGVLAEEYHEDVRTGKITKDTPELNLEFSEMDLSNVKTVSIQPGPVVRLEEVIQGRDNWTDRDVVVEFMPPLKVRLMQKGKMVEQPVPKYIFGFTTLENATLAQNILKAIPLAVEREAARVAEVFKKERFNTSQIVQCSNLVTQLYNLQAMTEEPSIILSKFYGIDVREEVARTFIEYLELKEIRYARRAGALLEIWRMSEIRPSDVHKTLQKLSLGKGDGLSEEDKQAVIALIKAWKAKAGKDAVRAAIATRMDVAPPPYAGPGQWSKGYSGFCAALYDATFE